MMSKVILVLDEMPESCSDCPCYDGDEELCNYMIVKTEFYLRPNWCPLRPVPEYKDVYHIDERSNYERGYNCCIDDILM
jgi:hypothetical protein